MHFLLLTKGSHENINFDTFKCSDENFLMSVFLQIWHDSLVSWYITPLYFFRSKVIYFAQKGPIKVTKFLSFLKQKISFSSNFAPLFGIMRHISSILFLAETLYTFIKSSLSKYKFGETSPEQSKVWNVALWWTRGLGGHCGKLTWGFKYEMWNLVNFHSTTQKSKNFTSMGSFFPNYMSFELKKYRGVIFHDTEQWCKIWINPDLVVSKMPWGIGWTFIKAPKSLKVVHWSDVFVQSIHGFS